jgi:hypothetical protein
MRERSVTASFAEDRINGGREGSGGETAAQQRKNKMKQTNRSKKGREGGEGSGWC